MNKIINFDLLSSPANWVIIFLILYFVALLAQVLYQASRGQSLVPFPSIAASQ